ncbi:hypothetical protein N7520_005395 [Penicillium odoratum]|uniref:uncharacterized protein n=1 Tax=Penicillium odoratum TaxID=1167516 RepID=UPI0025484155|nr:uncharacterized protein N7520_005395 [Penicillium odoratum]KAJ5765836.1 hypothetical protein N7520_005395 [Penicillium odoratum]
MLARSIISLVAVVSRAKAAVIEPRATTTTLVTSTSTSTGPNWFQTSPESYAGAVETGIAPFLVEVNPVTFSGVSYAPNSPLQTSEPIKGANGRDIFHIMGNEGPYHSPEEGFGVDEYPLPKGANITQMHMLHRHGSRYPGDNSLSTWAAEIANATASTRFTGELAFFNDYTYSLGENSLVPLGRQELFESGVLNWYNYGQLYNNSTKLVARTTTSDRMLKSAENFLAGFFGLEWTENANLLPIIEEAGFNNSLIGTYGCANALTYQESSAMALPYKEWEAIYLKDRTIALQQWAGDYNWTTSDSYNAQMLCSAETVALGWSEICQLFTYEEWEGFAYYSDLSFAQTVGFQSPTGRAQGIAWVEEFIARIEGHLLENTETDANMTLDTNPETFPIQSLYLDFTHDGGIVTTLTALGFEQFKELLPGSGPPANHQFQSSKIVPFAGRMNIEIIKAPGMVSTKRSTKERNAKDVYVSGTNETTYIHVLLNQRTVPLHASFSACEYRDDGWCELDTFMRIQKESLEKSKFDYTCNGNWTYGGFGTVTDGVPT